MNRGCFLLHAEPSSIISYEGCGEGSIIKFEYGMGDALAEDVVEGVGVAEKNQHEFVL